MDAILNNQVISATGEAAATASLPRFWRLQSGKTAEKSPGEWVAMADQEAEDILSRRL
jgi:fructose-1,6-bisphosphatase/inositol monophosphatase family enzyme